MLPVPACAAAVCDDAGWRPADTKPTPFRTIHSPQERLLASLGGNWWGVCMWSIYASRRGGNALAAIVSVCYGFFLLFSFA